jgi:trigger factor
MTIDASSLRIALEEEERWRRRLTVTVPASEVDSGRDEAMKKLSSRLKLPGFRKGKIPPNVLEQRFGSSLQQETLDKVIGAAYRVALESEELRPISEGQVEDINYQPASDLTFSIAFDVHPEIELARLGGFVVERPAVEVTDEQVDQVLDRLRDQNAVWHPAEDGAPEEGDLVTVQILRLDEGSEDTEAKSYEFVLGTGDAIPDVEEAIKSLEPGQSSAFAVTFPQDFPEESRQGESQQLEVTLMGRRQKELPALDDEFARSIGDFEGLEDLGQRVRADLEKEAENRVEGTVRGRLTDFVLEANPFTVPRSMVERYVDSLLGDTEGADLQKIEEIKASIRPEAERAVKRILVLDRIAETQDLRATEDEIDERVEGIAESSGKSPAEVYGRLQKSGALEQLERELTENKVFDFLKGQSEIIEAA